MIKRISCALLNIMMLSHIFRSASSLKSPARVLARKGLVNYITPRSATPRRAVGSVLSDDDLLAGAPVSAAILARETDDRHRATEGGGSARGDDSSLSASQAFFGEGVPFDKLSLRPSLVASLAEEGKIRSTDIQARAAAPLLAGDDVVIAAETGMLSHPRPIPYPHKLAPRKLV
jgi:hypothetical protein